MIQGHDIVATALQLTTLAVHRSLQQPYNSTNNSSYSKRNQLTGNYTDISSNSTNTTSHGDGNSTNGGTDHPGSNSAYEFVAFLMWYIFLVLCCIVPTCLAYRRRRLMEQRLMQQQETMSQLQQSNMVILNNLHQQQANHHNHRILQTSIQEEEAIVAARSALIKKGLLKTTMTVTENDLMPQPLSQETATAADSSLPSSLQMLHPWQRGKVFSMHETKDPAFSATDQPKEEDDFDTAVVPTVHDAAETKGGVTKMNDIDDNTLVPIELHEASVPETTNVVAIESADGMNASSVAARSESASPLFYDEEAHDNIDIYGLEDNGYLFLSLPLSDEAEAEKIEPTAEIASIIHPLSNTETAPSTIVPSPVASNANRSVPGTCVICLSNYVADEMVSWSPNSACLHAFHTDCIVPWLAKKVDQQFNCPVCRQEFCAVSNEELQLLPQPSQPLQSIVHGSSSQQPSFRHVVFGFASYPEMMQHANAARSVVSTRVPPTAATATTTTSMQSISAPRTWSSF